MHNLKRKFKSLYQPYSLTSVWLIIILAITCIPGNYIPVNLDFIEWLKPDKIVHFILFGCFNYILLAELDYNHQHLKSKIKWSIGLGISTLVSASTELLQYSIIAGRDGNLYDFFANILGCIMACYCFYFVKKQKIKKNNK